MKKTFLFTALLASSAIVQVAHAETPLKAIQINEQYKQPTLTQVNSAVTPIVNSHEELAQEVLHQMQNYGKNFTIQLNASMSKFDFDNFMEEVILRDSYVHGTYKGASLRWNGAGNQYKLQFTIDYWTDRSKEQVVDQYVRDTITQIIKPTMTTFEKIKAINDHVVLHATYSENTTNTPHAAYTLVTEGKGVCQAYALLTYKLLKEAGIHNLYVTGFAGIEHAWNLVEIDGKWYHLDTTWNDPVFANTTKDMSDYVRYTYFLMSDAQISVDHTIDKYGYPTANDERFSAFHNVETPVTVGDTLYFPAGNDYNKLYALSLSDTTLQARKLSDTRVQLLTVANGALYFSNYSHGAHLYKYDLTTGKETSLLAREVDDIKIVEGELLAYSSNNIVYKETIKEQPSNAVQQLRQWQQKLVFLNENFTQNAQQILALEKQLKNEGTAIDVDLQIFIEKVRTHLDKMNNLSFPSSVEWSAPKTTKLANKPWTIQFNYPIAATNSNKQKIKIVDMFGEAIDATVTLDGRAIKITPAKPYVKNVPYTLIIPSTVTSDNGKKLNQALHMEFKYID